MSFSSSGGLQYMSCGPEILVSIFSCKNGDLKSVSFVTAECACQGFLCCTFLLLLI